VTKETVLRVWGQDEDKHILEFSMFHRAFLNSIIDKQQHVHFFTFKTVLV